MAQQFHFGDIAPGLKTIHSKGQMHTITHGCSEYDSEENGINLDAQWILKI